MASSDNRARFEAPAALESYDPRSNQVKFSHSSWRKSDLWDREEFLYVRDGILLLSNGNANGYGEWRGREALNHSFRQLATDRLSKSAENPSGINKLLSKGSTNIPLL
jgi:hypothetical protein